MSFRSALSLLVTAAVLAGGGAGVALAGTGFGDSGPASIDTRHPVVTVDDPPANTVLQAGQTISLDFTLSDDNPGGDPGDNHTQVWLGDLLWEQGPDLPGSGSFTWHWTVPDTSSATVHLVVTATDAFGNVTVARSADFTILSGATGVPDAGHGLVFAPPAPNPFNPQTTLRFDLPEDGPVAVTVHDARGWRVRTLLSDRRAAGPLALTWNGTDDAGRRQAGGAYFFRLAYRQGGQVRHLTHKAILLP